ncbi:tyrosine-type recombinase/integrase [Paenibacillus thiaminolyticus]|nr:tyrosine-type recombinase/integrase [Paenibacillus thiaminolyticus]WII37982.1 tyrosine-type recombinase/integrase [Paenibacillus thiaminolyticus]
MLYTAVPLSMIQRLHLPQSFDGGVELLANEFCVPLDIAARRMEQIQRRCLQGMLQQVASSYRVPKVPVESRSERTEVFAYFDPYGDLDSPSQLIVSVDQKDCEIIIVFLLKSPKKYSDFPKIRFHDLRHTHVTLLLKDGIHPKIVQERLGHSSINVTLDTYSHVLPNLQEAVLKNFGDSILGDALVTPKEAENNALLE